MSDRPRAGGSPAPAAATPSGGASKVARVATLGIFALAMIEVAAVLTPRNYPSMAEQGWSLVGWYVLGLVLFFLPLSLAGAELATGWPKGGGVYAWVREAFGERDGFVSIWSEWAENVIWFPTVLAFITSTIAYGIYPDLLNQGWATFLIMMVIFWGVTWLNLYGERFSSRLSSSGAILGSILPSVVLVILMVVFIADGNSAAIPWTGAGDLLPTLDLGTLPFVQTVVLLFAGMEMAGFHALETRNPGRDFPRAIAISALLIFVLTTLGTLAIAYTVDAKELSLAGGMMQALDAMLGAAGATWLVVPMAVLIAFGAVAQLSTWLIGPAKGLGTAAAQGDLPKAWRTHNRFGSPRNVLLIQAAIASGLALLFVFMPSVNSAYWVLSAITTQILIVMYLFMFAAVIKLRRSQPDTPRAYRIPGGFVGACVVAGVALSALVFSFFIGLLPPQGIGFPIVVYLPFMLGASIVFSFGIPWLVYRFRKPSWRAPDWQAYLEGTEDGSSASPGEGAS
jgi:amino acid transporter